MRRSTVVIGLLALVMVGIYIFLNNRAERADIAVTVEPTEEVSYLFAAEDGTPTSIRIESKAGQIVEVARNAENAWALILPIEASADQGAAEAAASQLATIRILDHVAEVDPDILGLKVPEYTLLVKFTSGVERMAELGVVTPTGNGYYVRGPDDEIVIVSKSAVDALLGLLDNPPYLETPTPSPLPPTATETPLPATLEPGTPSEAGSTPTP